MVGHGGSSASSYLADPTSPIPSHCVSIVATSTVRVKMWRAFSLDHLNAYMFGTAQKAGMIKTTEQHFWASWKPLECYVHINHIKQLCHQAQGLGSNSGWGLFLWVFFSFHTRVEAWIHLVAERLRISFGVECYNLCLFVKKRDGPCWLFNKWFKTIQAILIHHFSQ